MRFEVAIAAGEVASNIIEHGLSIGFQMGILLLPEVVVVEFTDRGEAAEIDLAAVRMPDEMAPRGRGLAIAKALLGRLEYAHDDAGNHWRLLSTRFPNDCERPPLQTHSG